MIGNYVIRPAAEADLSGLVTLCVAHAAYERAAPPPADLAERLRPALFGPVPRLWCLVVELDGQLAGYLSYTVEFATWTGRDFVHMDCVYLADRHRGTGLGAALLDRLKDAARERGIMQVQWQTPVWNTDAIRFYDRSGAARAEKVRYTLNL